MERDPQHPKPIEVLTPENRRRQVPVANRTLQLKALPIIHQNGSQLGTNSPLEVNVAQLQQDLLNAVRGEVRFDAGTRGMYAHDASNYREIPIGVVVPLDGEDVEKAVAVARKHGVPILPRGGGTSIPGQGTNTALMIDFSKYMHSIIHMDAEARRVKVQPGIVCDGVRDAANRHGLTFGPDPATHSRCNIGGMIGNNSCGPHTVMAGRTSDNVEELEILLYDGTRMTVGRTPDEELQRLIDSGGRVGDIYGKLRDLRDKYGDLIREKFPNIPRRVSGFNLDELLPENGFNVARALVGSEGTCALTLSATLKLVPWPNYRVLLVIGFEDVYSAGDYVMEGLKFKPMALEGMDDGFIECMEKKGMHPKNIDKLPHGRAWLFIEFGGDTLEEATENASKLKNDLGRHGNPPHALFTDPVEQTALWHLREAGLGATAKVPGEPENHEGWEDTAVHPDHVGKYLRDLHALMSKFDYKGPLYGHFGDGCVHTRINFELDTKEGIANYRRFVEEGTDLVMRYNGSLSGEHGDGQAKGELLAKMFGDELIEAFAEFKRIWDPDWKMNPGKLIAPNKLDENLQEGPKWNLPQVQTYFSYSSDNFNFADASNRCVGAGVCRRKNGGIMCPSYMVTLEEKHSTRGRARLLYEMMVGDPVEGGWKSEEVKEALDLCLACKGCKGECPVQVDMATYKAEFLAHYYKGKLRPRHAYFFGLIGVWAKIASWVPEIANFFTHAPGFGTMAKKAIGIAEPRKIPAFASYTFKEWFFSRRARRVGGTKVILWADTFNNHFHPTTAQAAVEVLEAAGFEVKVPRTSMCCGRPLYDYGMLDTAKKWLLHILDVMRDDIQDGTPIVVLEPSCAATFRDELLNLFPHSEDAKRLSKQVFLLSDFLEKRAGHWTPPKLKRKAVVHGHCHHKSLMSMDDESAVLGKMGVETDLLNSGCCGMAGAFGFEKGQHYEVSIASGERVLLPAVRRADPETIIIADGFSCREQIAQTTDREALHLAQVLQMALLEGEAGTEGPMPERKYVKGTPPPQVVAKRVAVYAGIAAAIGGAIWLARRKR